MLRPILFAPLALTLFAASLAGGAAAQTMGNSSSRFNGGISGGGGSFNDPVQVGTRDLSNNRVIVDGMIQDGSGNSIFSRSSGVGDAVSGAGGVSTAIGNSLNVITQGNNNTVIVNAQQVNNGAIYAGTTLNGRVTLDTDQ